MHSPSDMDYADEASSQQHQHQDYDSQNYDFSDEKEKHHSDSLYKPRESTPDSKELKGNSNFSKSKKSLNKKKKRQEKEDNHNDINNPTLLHNNNSSTTTDKDGNITIDAGGKDQDPKNAVKSIGASIGKELYKKFSDNSYYNEARVQTRREAMEAIRLDQEEDERTLAEIREQKRVRMEKGLDTKDLDKAEAEVGKGLLKYNSTFFGLAPPLVEENEREKDVTEDDSNRIPNTESNNISVEPELPPEPSALEQLTSRQFWIFQLYVIGFALATFGT